MSIEPTIKRIRSDRQRGSQLASGKRPHLYALGRRYTSNRNHPHERDRCSNRLHSRAKSRRQSIFIKETRSPEEGDRPGVPQPKRPAQKASPQFTSAPSQSADARGRLGSSSTGLPHLPREAHWHKSRPPRPDPALRPDVTFVEIRGNIRHSPPQN